MNSYGQKQPVRIVPICIFILGILFVCAGIVLFSSSKRNASKEELNELSDSIETDAGNSNTSIATKNTETEYALPTEGVAASNNDSDTETAIQITEPNDPTEQPAESALYRVRTSWDNPSSQIGAWHNLEYAVAACIEGYYVFDENGSVVYDPRNPESNIGTTDISSVYERAKSPNAYKDVIWETISDIYAEEGRTVEESAEGVLTDINGDGVNELILVHETWWDDYEDEANPILVVSVYTVANGEVTRMEHTPPLDDFILMGYNYQHSDEIYDCGHVRLNGESYFVTRHYVCYTNGYEEISCNLYTVSDRTLILAHQLFGYREYYDLGNGLQVNGVCTIDGENVPVMTVFWDDWIGQIEAVATLDGRHPDDINADQGIQLTSLLAYCVD